MNKLEGNLMMWERKLLVKTYGQTCENVYWRIKMNQEMYNKFKSSNITIVIKVCRLEWLRHVVRMDSGRTIMKVLEGKPGGRRKQRKTLD
jgi:hypothetical protein